jgi:hypothetical protein
VRPLVFIPQEPMRKNRDGRWVSKGLDLAATADYGDTLIVWPPGTGIMQPAMLETEALCAADRYNDQRDYIVALGSPSLIAMLGWAIGRVQKQVRMLEWDRELRRYYVTLGERMNNAQR